MLATKSMSVFLKIFGVCHYNNTNNINKKALILSIYNLYTVHILNILSGFTSLRTASLLMSDSHEDDIHMLPNRVR
jgi:hypothetical protein